MKTYTLSWRRPDTWRKNGLCRCRFDVRCYYWLSAKLDAIGSFAFLLTFGASAVLPFGDNSFRLSSCGRLVARSATYQGV